MANDNDTKVVEAVTKPSYAVMSASKERIIRVLKNVGVGQGSINPIVDLPQVRVPTGGQLQWTIKTLTGTETKKELRGIIIHQHLTRSYWDDGGSAQAGQPPDCQSLDAEVGHGNPGGLCKHCPLAKFGSRGGGQACKLGMWVYLLGSEDYLPSLLALPVTSVKPARQYLMALSQRGKLTTDVETLVRITVGSARNGALYSKADFLEGAELPRKAADFMDQYGSSLRQVIDHTPYDAGASDDDDSPARESAAAPLTDDDLTDIDNDL